MEAIHSRASTWEAIQEVGSAPARRTSDGILAFSHPGLGAITCVAATYNGTHQQINQNSLVNSVYLFQTEAVVVQLKDSDLNPLDGGSVSYYASGWYGAGTTTGGEVAIEMLPGSYSFAVVYNHSRQQMDSINVTTPNPVVFQTGNVTVHYSGSAEWYFNGYYRFSTPQELLPGNTIVYLYGSPFGRCEVPITMASGDHLDLSGILATLSSRTRRPGRRRHGVRTGWKSVGTTDAAGRACALLDGTWAIQRSGWNTTGRTADQPVPANRLGLRLPRHRRHSPAQEQWRRPHRHR